MSDWKPTRSRRVVSSKRALVSGLLLVAVFANSGCDRESPAGSDAAPSAAGAGSRTTDVDWALHGGDAGEARYSTLADINQANVDQLGLAWSYELGTTRGVEATPIVKDGVMYVSAPWSVIHALDATNGKRLWRFDPEVPRQWARWACCDVVNRGVAVSERLVIVGTLDGRLVAVDRATGKQQWSVRTTPEDKAYTITGAPRLVGDKVVIGNGGAEYGVRGYITAYEVATGAEAWRFYTVPGNPADPIEHPDLEPALKTWFGEWWEVGGGGTAWDSMAYDPELNLLYVGVGNGAPWSRYERSPGGGDNLYLSSILAINPQTGRLAWHYQTTPGDNWDYTATQHILLAEVDLDGKPRKVLMQAPKNGFLYLLDRQSGELLDAKPYVHINWATHVDLETGRPVETPQGNYSVDAKQVIPGPQGGHNWQPMSYSQRSELLYLPAHDTGLWYANEQEFKYNPATWNLGLDVPELIAQSTESPPEFRGHLVAWDPKTMKPVWQKRFDAYWNGGVLSTAGGLVFQGTADGRLVAYRDVDGAELWESESTTGFIAPPISYRIDGVQYLAVAAGIGGGAIGNVLPGAKINDYLNEGRILVYRLGGRAPMPVSTKRDLAVPVPPPVTASAETLALGDQHYHTYCGFCHGLGVVSGFILPDLRYTPASKHAAFEQIVLEGALVPLGMPSFADSLNPSEVAAIQAYVLSQAHLLHEAENGSSAETTASGGD